MIRLSGGNLRIDCVETALFVVDPVLQRRDTVLRLGGFVQ